MVTPQPEMAQVELASMERSLPMSRFGTLIPIKESFQWPMQELTPTDLNSLLSTVTRPTSITSTQSLAELFMGTRSARRLSRSRRELATSPSRMSRLRTAVNSLVMTNSLLTLPISSPLTLSDSRIDCRNFQINSKPTSK